MPESINTQLVSSKVDIEREKVVVFILTGSDERIDFEIDRASCARALVEAGNAWLSKFGEVQA